MYTLSLNANLLMANASTRSKPRCCPLPIELIHCSLQKQTGALVHTQNSEHRGSWRQLAHHPCKTCRRLRDGCPSIEGCYEEGPREGSGADFRGRKRWLHQQLCRGQRSSHGKGLQQVTITLFYRRYIHRGNNKALATTDCRGRAFGKGLG